MPALRRLGWETPPPTPVKLRHPFRLHAALAAGTIGAFAAEPRWISLFDGRTLDGWQLVQGHAKFEVRDGAIVW